MASEEAYKLAIYGLISDTSFHVARCCAEDLCSKNPKLFCDPELQGMLEFDWDTFAESKRKELKGDVWSFNEKAFVFCNGDLVGGPTDFFKWAEQEFNYENFRPAPLYETLAEEAYKNFMNSKKHDFVFMAMSIDDKPIGKLVFELFTDLLPKTCDNFRTLCTGEKGESPETEYQLHYKDSIFHRIVPNGWIQGGDIWMKKGDGGESIYGPVFEDESFSISHDKRGILSMANKGRHSNGSQFFITLQPSKWMDTKYVAFGQVIEGSEVLRAMEEQETNNERPLKDIKIVDCGISQFVF